MKIPTSVGSTPAQNVEHQRNAIQRGATLVSVAATVGLLVALAGEGLVSWLEWGPEKAFRLGAALVWFASVAGLAWSMVTEPR